ncbi:Lrp/AsnC family transcriptional regulator [Thalassomonas viridans]|uniref:siroheme decarboxylase n=2 Tax=Thalassomonas viridans TaxID=137584 RepID=A0AAE9Z7P2_9GAMM|nr:Lrp/AsnC family transcriptional regulator [Thalassomonas viridans]
MPPGAPEASLTQEQQRQLRVYLEQGLPLSPHPYREIAARLATGEAQIMTQIKQWQEQSLIRRLGLVVKHRQLGYRANAMVVWDIKDTDMEHIAGQLAARPEVSLCYQRPRRLPHWHYNLFCMIHGKDRSAVLEQINLLTRELALEHVNKDVLFSYKAFKQQGARYSQRKTADDRA